MLEVLFGILFFAWIGLSFVWLSTFAQAGRVPWAKRGFRYLRVRWATAIAATASFILAGIVAQGLPPSGKPSAAAPVADARSPEAGAASAGFEIGKSYEVARAAWVCATVEGLSLTSKDSLVGSEGFTNTLVEGRKEGCNPIFPETYHVVILENDAALVKVRIVCRNEAANGFEGWTEAEDVSTELASSAEAKEQAKRDDQTKTLCAVEAADVETVAKGRDAGKSDAAALAEHNGDIDNKIVSLIYETPHSSPDQEREAVSKVCLDTDAFMRGVGVPDNASLDKIDASILHAIRLQLMQH